MEHDIQKASLWKRIAAGILDLILVAVLATGFGAAISALSGYDAYSTELQQKYDDYHKEYNLNPDLTLEAYEQMSPDEQQAYAARVEQADAALRADERAMYVYQIVSNLMIVMVTGSVLLAILLSEFVIPLLFGNGQTVGKKVFSLCVIRNDGVKLNGLQHFTRVILGKYAIETMLPLYVAILFVLGQNNVILILFAAALLLAQLVLVVATRNHSLLHDLMAGTVVADYASQRIFKSTEDLIAYQKRIAAERANRQTY